MKTSIKEYKTKQEKHMYLKDFFFEYGMELLNVENEFKNIDSKLSFRIIKGKFNKPHNTIINISRRYGYNKFKDVGTAYKSKKQVVGIKDNKTVYFDSISEASQQTNIFGTSITKNCKGKSKSAGGYKWMYIEDYD